MCLSRIIGKNPLRIADEDIICYRGVQVNADDWDSLKVWWQRKRGRYNNYTTYFQMAPVVIGETFIAQPVLRPAKLEWIDCNEGELNGGFVHSFKNKKDAIEFARWRSHVDVVECIIPAGTPYFEGWNHDGSDGYASTKLKYVKVINPWKFSWL